MSIRRFFLILLLVIFLGMVCVYQHSQSIRAGYQINKLLGSRSQLIEDYRADAYALLRMKSPQFIREQVVLMELDLMLPGETRPSTAVAQKERGVGAQTD